MSAWRFFSAQTLRLCPFVRASVLLSAECWTLTCPIPASLSFTVPALCTKNENSYWESFCFHGGDTSRYTQFDKPRKQHLLKYINKKNKNVINSTMGTNMVLCSFYFGLAVLLEAPFTHTQLQLNLQVCLSVSDSFIVSWYFPLPLFFSLWMETERKIHELVLVSMVITCSCISFDLFQFFLSQYPSTCPVNWECRKSWMPPVLCPFELVTFEVFHL